MNNRFGGSPTCRPSAIERWRQKGCKRVRRIGKNSGD